MDLVFASAWLPFQPATGSRNNLRTHAHTTMTILYIVLLEYLSLFYQDLNETRAQFVWMTDWVVVLWPYSFEEDELKAEAHGA